MTHKGDPDGNSVEQMAVVIARDQTREAPAVTALAKDRDIQSALKLVREQPLGVVGPPELDYQCLRAKYKPHAKAFQAVAEVDVLTAGKPVVKPAGQLEQLPRDREVPADVYPRRRFAAAQPVVLRD
jgi:hypothetical protein